MKKLIPILTLASVLSLTGCDLFDDRAVEHVSPLVNFQPSVSVQPVWSHHVSDGTSGHYLRLTPAVAGGAIFTTSLHGKVVAVDAESGHSLWQRDIKRALTSGISASKNKLVVGTADGHVMAMSARNGRPLWEATVASEVLATPVIQGNAAVVKTESGDVYAFNLSNGKRMWHYQVAPPELMLRGASMPQIKGDSVVAGFPDAQLVKLRLQNGKVVWRRQVAIPHGATVVDRLVDIDASPVIRDNTVYVATYQGKVAAIGLSDGRVKWSRDMSSYSGITVDRKAVYITDAESQVWALNRNNGRVLWRQEKLSGRGASSPALYGSAILVGDNEGYLHLLSRQDGHFLARVKVDGTRILTAPIVLENSFVVYTAGGELVAYQMGRVGA